MSYYLTFNIVPRADRVLHFVLFCFASNFRSIVKMSWVQCQWWDILNSWLILRNDVCSSKNTDFRTYAICRSQREWCFVRALLRAPALRCFPQESALTTVILWIFQVGVRIFLKSFSSCNDVSIEMTPVIHWVVLSKQALLGPWPTQASYSLC